MHFQELKEIKKIEDTDKILDKNNANKFLENESMIVEIANDLNLDYLDLDDIDIDDDDKTIHTKQEHPFVNISIVECPVNYGKK